jgi:hypothetical protein
MCGLLKDIAADFALLGLQCSPNTLPEQPAVHLIVMPLNLDFNESF